MPGAPSGEPAPKRYHQRMFLDVATSFLDRDGAIFAKGRAAYYEFIKGFSSQEREAYYRWRNCVRDTPLHLFYINWWNEQYDQALLQRRQLRRGSVGA